MEEQKLNWKACKADPVCYSEAEKWQETGELVGGIAGSAVPGVAIPAQKGIGYMALALAMLLGGNALRKKEKNG